MKQFEVIWTKNAQFDLESIIEYIKIDSLSIAKKIFLEMICKFAFFQNDLRINR